MDVFKDFKFEMAHRLPNHNGLCKNIHGHSYKVTLAFEGLVKYSEGGSDEGMVVDFCEVKEIAEPIFKERLDHSIMLSRAHDQDIIALLKTKGMRVNDVDYIPTCENLALEIFKELEPHFKIKNIVLKAVTVWETATAGATYSMTLK